MKKSFLSKVCCLLIAVMFILPVASVYGSYVERYHEEVRPFFILPPIGWPLDPPDVKL